MGPPNSCATSWEFEFSTSNIFAPVENRQDIKSNKIVLYTIVYCNIFIVYIFEASRGASAQSVTVNATDHRFDSHLKKIKYYTLYIYFHFFALVLRQTAG